MTMAVSKGAWRPVGAILGGGTVSSLAISPNYAQDGLIAAGTAAGVYGSTDEARTWTPLGAGACSPLNVQGVVFSPTFQRDEHLLCGGLGGFMRSADAGRHWMPPEVWPGSQSVSALAVSPSYADDSTLLLGTQDQGVYISSNGGRIWAAANFGLGDLLILAVAFSPEFASDATAFAVAGDGVYRTSNGGRAWRAVGADRGLDSDLVQAIALSPDFGRDRTLFVGTEEAGIFRSTDRGASWTAVREGLGDLSINAIYVPPDFARHGTVYAGTGEGLLFRSTDGGETWERLAEGLPPILAITALPSGDPPRSNSQRSTPVLLAGCHQAGVFRSEDGGHTWAESSTGLAARPVLTFGLSPRFPEDHRAFATGLEDGVLRSNDGGATWEVAAEGLPERQVHALAISPALDRDGTLFAATAQGVFRSVDGGDSWQACGAVEEAGAGDTRGVAVSPTFGLDGHVAALDAKGRLSLSTDRGGSWRQLNAQLEGAEVVALSFSPHFGRDRVLLAAAARSAGFNGVARPASVSVWRTPDAGGRWLKMWETPHSSRWVVLAVPPTYRGDGEYNDRFFFAVGNTVYRPMWRVKRQWYAERLGSTRNAVLALAVSPRYETDRTVFAATTEGVYLSRDEGLTWQQLSAGLLNRAVAAIVPSPAFSEDRRLFALTLGGTVWVCEP